VAGSSTPEGHQQKMLGCQQRSAEPKAQTWVLISLSLAFEPAGGINHKVYMWRMASAMPDLWLPSHGLGVSPTS